MLPAPLTKECKIEPGFLAKPHSRELDSIIRLMISHQDSWLTSPEHLLWEGAEIHVWRAYLNEDASTVQALSSVLAPDERQRASKYQFQKDREHFVVARGVLREILSRYLNSPPAQIRLSYNYYGKPALNNGTGDNLLHFNMSRSLGVALYAITRGREIGVDIEFIREDFPGLEIAKRFFSPREVAMLQALPPHSQTAAFFNCWTRKEAYIKARGEGSRTPCSSFPCL